jgi:hypothetical protein
MLWCDTGDSMGEHVKRLGEPARAAALYQHWQRLPRDMCSNSSENCEYLRFTRCAPLKFAKMLRLRQ